jgi:adenine-specific DNA-methyltransferase
LDTITISSQFDPQVDFVLYEGDCLELLKNIPDDFVQLVVTSPPYNLGKPYETQIHLDEYIEGQRRVINECVRVLKHQGSICWQVGNYVDKGQIIPLDIPLYSIFAGLGLQLRNRIVWQFGHGLHASRRFSGRYEVILWFTRQDAYTFNLDAVRVPQKYPQKKYFKGPKKGEYSSNPLGKNPGDVWDIPNVKSNHVEKTAHPAQFPVELIERLVLAMSDSDDWVLDPFLGSGTAAIAALMHQRRAIGAEVMPDYIQITKERLALAQRGQLRIRPMERNVYDPDAPNNIPPKFVQIGAKEKQLGLLDLSAEYNSTDGDE